MNTGRLIPTVIGTVGVLIVGTGFLPLQWFGFQDYEIARQVRQWDAPFMPNVHFRSKTFVGNEADAANLPPTERLPLRTFSTDSLGFRRAVPVRPGEAPSVMVFRGFSFVFGVGLSDEETFPSQLAQDLGLNVYNGARFHDDPEMPAEYDRLTRKLGVSPNLVVYVHLEPNGHVLSWNRERPLGRAAKAIAGQRAGEALEHTALFLREFPLNWIRVSPMIRAAVEAKKALENDRILTNRYRENARSFQLPDGRRLLFRTGDFERVQTPPDDSVVRDRAAYIEWWNDELERRGARMVVLLVPEKLSVYGPELGVGVPADPYLNRLERQLRDHGIGVVNGLPVLRAHAAEDIATGRLAYLREDEHWNALGVSRLAEATAEALKTDSRSLHLLTVAGYNKDRAVQQR